MFPLRICLLPLFTAAFATKMPPIKPVLLVHGGAGDIPDSRVPLKLAGVKKSAIEGYKVLQETGNVLDAIETAIKVMEDDEAFNAGRGSVLNLEGEVEMEAQICEGKDLNAGAVTLVKNIAHPITLARMVMEKTPHTMLGGKGAEDFIVKSGLPRVPDDYLITQTAKDALEKFKKRGGDPTRTEIGSSRPGDVGTVGCVAVDASGHVASGTSTGGITGKYRGRIGDTPQLGSGGYCDDLTGAVSATGHGESILKYNLSHRILNQMALGKTPEEAAVSECEGMTKRVGKTAGAIVLSNNGTVGIGFTSKRMAWAYVVGDDLYYGIEPGQNLREKVQ